MHLITRIYGIMCYKYLCILFITFIAAEVMFRRADDTVFESDLPVQFELLLQPSELIDEDITIQILTISSTAIGMYICMCVLVSVSPFVCVCVRVRACVCACVLV